MKRSTALFPATPLLVTLSLALAYPQAAQAADLQAKLVGVRMIWDKAPHNAFGDLVRWRGRFFATFREGKGHGSFDGKIRIISSADGERWQSEALLVHPDRDLRDSKLAITPDGRLMLVCGATKVSVTENRRLYVQTMVAFSRDGTRWGPLRFVTRPHRWLWRVTWFRNKAYGVSYADGGDPKKATELLVSDDGVEYRVLVPSLLDEGWPTEGTLRFDARGRCYCLQRRDRRGKYSNSAYLGVADPPYTDWRWRDLGIYVGGPDLIQSPSGEWLVCGRRLGPKGARTVLWQLDVSKGKLNELLELPSGGDTSYPRMLFVGEELWILYYSSHERKSKIYLARVLLAETEADR